MSLSPLSQCDLSWKGPRAALEGQSQAIVFSLSHPLYLLSDGCWQPPPPTYNYDNSLLCPTNSHARAFEHGQRIKFCRGCETSVHLSVHVDIIQYSSSAQEGAPRPARCPLHVQTPRVCSAKHTARRARCRAGSTRS